MCEVVDGAIEAAGRAQRSIDEAILSTQDLNVALADLGQTLNDSEKVSRFLSRLRVHKMEANA